MHEMPIKIRSTQVDTFGHLNNAAYLEIYEWGRWEWSEAGGVHTLEMVEGRGIGPAIVHIDLHFHREIRIHEEVVVRTWFDSLEGLKGIIGQEMLKRDGTIASRARFTFVMFDLKSRKVIRVPDDLRRLFGLDTAYRQERQTRADSGPGKSS